MVRCHRPKSQDSIGRNGQLGDSTKDWEKAEKQESEEEDMRGRGSAFCRVGAVSVALKNG